MFVDPLPIVAHLTSLSHLLGPNLLSHSAAAVNRSLCFSRNVKHLKRERWSSTKWLDGDGMHVQSKGATGSTWMSSHLCCPR